MATSAAKTRRKVWIQRGLSVFLVFHVLVIVIMPNEQFYPRQQLLGAVGPYINLLGLNVAWKFFAPDPAPATFLEFDVTHPGADGKPRNETMDFPDLEDPFFFRQHYNRRVAVKNLLAAYPNLMRQVVLPRIVCPRFPGATNVGVSSITVSFPSLKEVREGAALNDIEAHRNHTFVGDEVCVSLAGGAQ